ncbi:unnamed protein product [Clavelina lepadiformis]|uniref:Cytochrome P450 n=1 Tax=Clavelina lepadiformis TaxID=159417 RepID=A0ABP0F0S9_CLALP
MLYRWWSYPSANFPPGVRGYPVVGALPYLGRYPERAIAKWSRKKYGPIMSVRFGTKDIVVINDYDQLHAAFITKGWSFKDRPPVPLFDTLSGGRLGFTFRDADTEWKIQRNFALSKLKEHGLIQLKVEERVKKAVAKLIDHIRKRNGGPFDISGVLGATICNVICHIAIGQEYDFEDQKFQAFVKDIYNL